MEAERGRQRGGQGTVLTAWPAGLWGLLRPFPNNREVQPAFFAGVASTLMAPTACGESPGTNLGCARAPLCSPSPRTPSKKAAFPWECPVEAVRFVNFDKILTLAHIFLLFGGTEREAHGKHSSCAATSRAAREEGD